MMHAFLDWKRPLLAIIADKAYGGTKIRQQIAEEDALCVVPAKSNARNLTPHDANLYAMRNIVQRFFRKMKDMQGDLHAMLAKTGAPPLTVDFGQAASICALQAPDRCISG